MNTNNSLHRIVLSCWLVNCLWLLPANTSLANMDSALRLHEAVQQKDNATIEKLIASGKPLDIQDRNGWTALLFAIKGGDRHAVKMLLAAGASPDVADRLGQTPLHLAVTKSIDITHMLIKANADVDARNAGGVTVLMMAAGRGRQDIVDILLAAGARLDYKDYQGNSILDWSRRSDNAKLTAFLTPRLIKAVAEAPKESGEDFAEDKFADAVHPTWFKLSYLDLDEDLNDALQNGKKGLMVYFGLKRCSYCQAFMENTLSKPDIEKRVQRLFDSVGMDIFSDNEMTDPTGRKYVVKDFVTAKKANYSPTMIFYGAKGREILKIVGYYPPNKFRTVLDYLEGQHYKRESLRNYVTRAERASAKQVVAIKTDTQLFPTNNYQLDRRTRPAKRPLLVMFEQPDCKACDRFHQRVLTDTSIRRLMGQFDTLHLDATNSTTRLVTPTGSRVTPKTWFDRLGLSYSPAMVFFDEAGKEIMRLDSEAKRWRMEGTLQLILEKAYKHDTQVQRWRRDKAVLFYSQQEK